MAVKSYKTLKIPQLNFIFGNNKFKTSIICGILITFASIILIS